MDSADRLVAIMLSQAPVAPPTQSAIYNFKNVGSKQIASIVLIGENVQSSDPRDRSFRDGWGRFSGVRVHANVPVMNA